MNQILIAILSLLTGCAAASAGAPSTAPTTAPEQTLLRMSDAVPLSRLRTSDNGTDFNSRVKTAGQALLFGQLDTYSDDGEVIATEPVIAYKDASDTTQVLRINDRRLHDAAWQFVATGPKTGEIWGVLDASLEAMQENILLVHSTDDGQTFAVIAIHKPDRRADYDSFSLDKTGRGRLSVFMAGDAKRHLLQG